jgi:hypothetical protein
MRSSVYCLVLSLLAGTASFAPAAPAIDIETTPAAAGERPESLPFSRLPRSP